MQVGKSTLANSLLATDPLAALGQVGKRRQSGESGGIGRGRDVQADRAAGHCCRMKCPFYNGSKYCRNMTDIK